MSSAAGNVFLPSELDASNIGVRALKSLSNGGKIASITYNGS
jgi:hypothetical protein